MTPPLTLISFVGVTDARLAPDDKGPVLSAVQALQPGRVVLIATVTPGSQHDLVEGASKVKKAIARVAAGVQTTITTMDLTDPTDHNDIYPQLRELVQPYCGPKADTVAAISSGTPSMQVCWILLAESGDASLRLIRTVEPELSTKVVREVKLGSGLPRITALEVENQELRALVLPQVKLRVKHGTVHVGDALIKLSPTQFAYYRYFLERCKAGKKREDRWLRISQHIMSDEFTSRINAYQYESFPDAADSDPVRLKKQRPDIAVEVFRTTLSKLNKKIEDALQLPHLAKYYLISYEGPKNARHYGIDLDPTKIDLK